MLSVVIIIGAIILVPVVMACVFHAMICNSLRRKACGE